MGDLQIWHSRESVVLADWFISHTRIGEWTGGAVVKRNLFASDASAPNDFHRLPARIKDILYLDCPDLIFSVGDHPFAALEISEEAGTGHNAFQRFARVAAAIENGVSAFYIYPQAAWVKRQGQGGRWDQLNPMIFQALEDAMAIHNIPALLYYHPTEFDPSAPAPPTSSSGPKGHLYDPDPHFPKCPDPTHPEMQALFHGFNDLLDLAAHEPVSSIGGLALKRRWARDRCKWMSTSKHARAGGREEWSPLTATITLETSALLANLSRHVARGHDFGDLIPKRPKSLIFHPKGEYRTQGDPYTGVAAALDYMKCRTGPSYEDRDLNLVVAFGEVEVVNGQIRVSGPASVNDYVDAVRGVYGRPGNVLLSEKYADLHDKIPRYMMQVRHGTTFTKRKDLRMFAYFCDALLFPDGSLWREA